MKANILRLNITGFNLSGNFITFAASRRASEDGNRSWNCHADHEEGWVLQVSERGKQKFTAWCSWISKGVDAEVYMGGRTYLIKSCTGLDSMNFTHDATSFKCVDQEIQIYGIAVSRHVRGRTHFTPDTVAQLLQLVLYLRTPLALPSTFFSQYLNL